MERTELRCTKQCSQWQILSEGSLPDYPLSLLTKRLYLFVPGYPDGWCCADLRAVIENMYSPGCPLQRSVGWQLPAGCGRRHQSCIGACDRTTALNVLPHQYHSPQFPMISSKPLNPMHHHGNGYACICCAQSVAAASGNDDVWFKYRQFCHRR
jgi:hypothetical protein